jgi:hypothetical protein
VAVMICFQVAGTVLVCALAITDCPFAVTAGLALLLVAVSVAWECLKRRRERRAAGAREDARAARARLLAGWTVRDEAILGGDLSPAAWERAGQLRQGDSR